MRVCGQEVKVQGSLIRIARLEADGYYFLDNAEAFVNGLRQCNARIDLFTFMQKLPETTSKYAYPMEWDNFAAVHVSTFDHWWTQQIEPEVRRKVRKAEKKGVMVREVAFGDDLVKGIWEIYNEHPIRQGKPFIHYGKDIETVEKEAGTFRDSSIFIGAFLGDTLIGFIKLIIFKNQSQANTMQVISMIKHRDKAPTNALLAHAVRSCAERGIPYLVYSRFSYGKKQRDSLSDFKQHNGFQRIVAPRYYVPLTYLGRAAFRLGLHHRFVDRLPESVVGRIRELRNAWYNRKFQAVKESA